jgi:hypothetical protein
MIPGVSASRATLRSRSVGARSPGQRHDDAALHARDLRSGLREVGQQRRRPAGPRHDVVVEERDPLACAARQPALRAAAGPRRGPAITRAPGRAGAGPALSHTTIVSPPSAVVSSAASSRATSSGRTAG